MRDRPGTDKNLLPCKIWQQLKYNDACVGIQINIIIYQFGLERISQKGQYRGARHDKLML